MSQVRPKRKATNRAYKDTLDESIFEEKSVVRNPNGSNGIKKKSTVTHGGSHPETKINTTTGTSTNSKTIPYNWEPTPEASDYFSPRLNLTDAYVDIETQTLYCPHYKPYPNSTKTSNGACGSSTSSVSNKKSKSVFQLHKNDFIYMVSEPPGEPYYIGCIMGFERKTPTNDSNQGDIESNSASNFQFKIQWFYRPRDISKSTSDSRLLFASMHTDTCPLMSYRGLVSVRHKSDIENDHLSLSSDSNNTKRVSKSPTPLLALEEYAMKPNCFYFNQLFDRYMIKFYDVISTKQLLNQSNEYKNFVEALHKRFGYIFVETTMTKSFINSFTSSASNCDTCGQWCSSQDSVNCVVCNNYFHMYCLDPPLLKKPSRGFSWSCAQCSKRQAAEHQQKSLMLMLSHDNKSSNINEISGDLNHEDDESLNNKDEIVEAIQDVKIEKKLPKFETMAIEFLEKDKHLSFEDRRLKEEWTMRYLGMYTRLEDGVDIDDRSPYPRASTRLGTKHQATDLPEFEGYPLVYYDSELPKKDVHWKRRKKGGSKRKDQSGNEEFEKMEVPKEYQNVPIKDYPQWLQPRPQGYLERGLDDGEGKTCTLLFKASEADIAENFAKLDAYVEKCSSIAQKLDLSPTTPNFIDQILYNYMKNEGNSELAFEISQNLTRESLKEPTFSPQEILKFEEGVKKYGSELYPTFKEVKTQPSSMIVRFYYLWKKTENGRQIWGNFEGRLHKKLQNQKEQKIEKTSEIDELASNADDSCFDINKIKTQKRKMACKHCNTNKSFSWHRITGYDATTKLTKNLWDKYDKNSVIGLCFRCAKLWRRYAVVWEDPLEVRKKNTRGVGGWKKKVEYELVCDSDKIIAEAAKYEGGIAYERQSSDSSVLEEPQIIKTLQKLNSQEPITKNSKKSSSTNLKSVEPPQKKVKSAVGGDSVSKVEKPSNTPNSKSKVDSKITTKKQTIKEKEKKPPAIKNSKKRTKEDTKNSSVEEALPKSKKNKSGTNIVANPVKPAIKKSKTTIKAEVKLEEQNKKKKPNKNKMNELKINSDYKLPKDENVDDSNIMYKLQSTLERFKAHQLTDLKTQISQASSVPNSATIEPPYAIDSRPCSICRELDNTIKDDMLICSNCGVNVHASCSYISVGSSVERPVKEWLCDICINDLNPQHSTLYSCSLCLSYESNYELTMLGSSKVCPDFLRPIQDSGKWCHFLCALFGKESISFKTTPIRKSKANDEISELCNIQSCSKVYVENYDKQCNICNNFNGVLVPCELCPQEYYHPTCAQDTNNYKIGFKLETDAKVIKVGENSGRLVPAILCAKHGSDTNMLSLHTCGRRLTGITKEEPRSLIQLYMDEKLRKSDGLKITGPQAKANSYVQLLSKFNEKENYRNSKLELLNATNGVNGEKDINPSKEKKCVECDTQYSPVWWPANKGEFICHCCQIYQNKSLIEENPKAENGNGNQINTILKASNTEYKRESSGEPISQSLLDVLNQKLSGDRFGICDVMDKLPIESPSSSA